MMRFLFSVVLFVFISAPGLAQKRSNSSSLNKAPEKSNSTQNNETKTTKSGKAVFTKISPQELRTFVLNPLKFGEAWQDPSGVVWGDTVRDEQGNPILMTYSTAYEHCLDIGARLPTNEDFRRLVGYLGGQTMHNVSGGRIGPSYVEGYVPQILPNLYEEKVTDLWRGYVFWASLYQYDSDEAYVFSGKSGNDYLVDRTVPHGFRCVANRLPEGVGAPVVIIKSSN